MTAINIQIPAIKAEGALTLDKVPCKKGKEDGSEASGENQVPADEERNETANEVGECDTYQRNAVKRRDALDAQLPRPTKKQQRMSFGPGDVEELCTLLMTQMLPALLESFGETAPSFVPGSRTMARTSTLSANQSRRPIMKRRHARVNFLLDVNFEFDVSATVGIDLDFVSRQTTDGSTPKETVYPGPTTSNEEECISGGERDAIDSEKHGSGCPISSTVRSTEEATKN